MTSVRRAIADLRSVHMVGIGGSGMSSMALVIHDGGAQVTGCDRMETSGLTMLRDLGIPISIGHSAEHLRPELEVLVHTAAVPAESDEIEAARRNGVLVLSRAEVLGMLVNGSRCLAVTGAHGKSTTSAMIATVFMEAGRDPTFLIGTELQGEHGGRLGSSEWAVVEADEAFGSFLHLHPYIGVMTNYDVDHLDHYGDEASLRSGYRTFLESCETAIVNADDETARDLAPQGHRTFALDAPADVSGTAVVGRDRIDLQIDSELGSTSTSMSVGGRHNAENALAAAAACLAAGSSLSEIAEGLERFKGTSRRFEKRGRYRGAEVIDDYAHLPREVMATIERARLGKPGRVVAVFQPHTYTRTQLFWAEFATALSRADLAIVTDVYAAREPAIDGIDGSLIATRVDELGGRAIHAPRLEDAVDELRRLVRANDLILTMGAGDVTQIADMLMADG